MNERIVLEAVWEHGPVHRAEVARILHVNRDHDQGIGGCEDACRRYRLSACDRDDA